MTPLSSAPGVPRHAPRRSLLPAALAIALAPLPLLALAETPAPPRIVVDGRLDDAAWATARRFDDFRIVEPYTLALPDPTLATEALLLSTPEGIAIGFRMRQPASVPLLAPRAARDEMVTADRVNVFLDFDADGRVAYNFTLLASGSIQDHTVTNENLFSPDFDTAWSHAVALEDGGWTAELLIPWTTAAMRDAHGDTRTIGLHLDRVVASRNERQGWPAASFLRGRFISDFARIEIPQYPASLLHVWPYATVMHDRIDGDTRWKTGLDLFWKPSAGFQLSAALNPDFGQVEADDLVVNFEAVEVFFSDRRPFFTENQAFFDLRTPDRGQLIYTRRIGGPADDGRGISDINLALKANGSWGALGYGVFTAREADHNGRDFLAGRTIYQFSPALSLGWLGTHTERPFFDRTADVQAADLHWKASDDLLLAAQWIGSDIVQAGRRQTGQGGWVRANWSASERLHFGLEATHFGQGLDFNDLGYLRRGSLNELGLRGEYVHPAAAADSALASTRWSADLRVRGSDSGVRLPSVLTLLQSSTFRNGDRLDVHVVPRSSGYDDLISRGNGLLWRSSRTGFNVGWFPAREGTLGWDFNIAARPEGLSRALAVETDLQAYWFPTDLLNITIEIEPMWSPDWLIWKNGTRFARHSRRLDAANVRINWFPAPRHELRLKTEWLAIRARNGSRYALQPGGGLLAAAGAEPDFDINTFGFQVRYRWEFAPQSDLFLVYSRGGFLREEREGESTLDLLDEALGLRDADQVLAKLRYRF